MAETLKTFFRNGELVLVPYTPDLIRESHIRWLNNKELMRYSEQRHRTHTMETQRNYLENFPPESFIWLIREDDGAGVYDVGTITAYIDPPNGVASMGIMVHPGGRGYAINAWNKVIDWLSGTVRKVECGTMRSNIGMTALAKRSGMSQEAVVPNHFMLDGKPEDLVLLGMCYD